VLLDIFSGISNVEPERIPEVLERLGAIPGGIVREVVGPYDVVVELEADTEEDLAGVLRHKINPIPGGYQCCNLYVVC
jgi:DNA-binding Lrp family transcriptional regulator